MKKGITYALTAYISWGLFPLFWKTLSHVDALESLAHRLVWTFVLVGLILLFTGRLKSYLVIMKCKQIRTNLFVSIVLMLFNWFLFIWAVNNNRVVEASLGYFLNPIVSVVLGVIFFKEKLNKLQKLAVLIALLGIGCLIVSYGKFPFIAIILAFCFSFYGFIRKKVEVESLTGLFIEVSYVFPLAIAFIIYRGIIGSGAFSSTNIPTSLLLLITGPVTALPLILFAKGAKALPLSLVGILQFIAPMLQFLTGVLVFKESFPLSHQISFSFIWISVLLFTISKNKDFNKDNSSNILSNRSKVG